MTFVIALGFVLVVLIAGQFDHSFIAALLAGLGIGAWLTYLVDRRIRHLAGEHAPVADANAPIYAALEDIHWRLKRLEEAGGLGPSPLEAERETAMVAPAATTASAVVMELEPGLLDAAASPHTPATAPLPVVATDRPVEGPTTRPSPPPQAMADALPPVPAATSAGPSAAPAPRTTPEEGWLESLLSRGRDWLLGGNTVVRVGIVVLFFGVAFLLKFAIDRAVLPLELRVAGVGAGALALLAIGWHLRAQRSAYALALQGAGVGLLYLTFFGAFRLYHLLPAGVALGTMVLVAGLSAVLALRQNSPALISLGVSGGFLAPILASTGSGNHVALFSYYAVLNLGILAVAWQRAWRPLNLLGFFFTAGIGLLWGTRSYTPELFASTEPFLLFFFALFLAVAVLFGLRQEEAPASASLLPKGVVDGTLVFGLPLLAFGFQAGLVKPYPFGLAYSALGLAALYLGLAAWLRGRARPGLALLVDSFLALGVIFLTLAIPLALDARWTSASWALEGAALVWISIHQQRRAAQVFGLLLQGAAALAWLIQPGSWQGDLLPVVNTFCLGATLIALAGLFSAWQLQTRVTPPPGLALPLFLWGLGWWLLAGLGEIDRLFSGSTTHAATVAFLAATAALYSLAARRLCWAQAQLPALGLPLALGICLVLAMAQGLDVMARFGWLAWPLALATHFALLHVRDREDSHRAWAAPSHALAFWLVAALGSHALYGQAREADLADGWQLAALALVPVLLLWAVASQRLRSRWPMAAQPAAYRDTGLLPLLACLALWVVVPAAGMAADPAPLPWLPLLNPVDLVHLMLLLGGIAWVRSLQADPVPNARIDDPGAWRILAGVLVFIWLNTVLLRSIHYWADVPYHPDALMASTLVQAALSLFWTLLALVLMATGARRILRPLWMTGAVLMAVVVAKLFLIDLDRVGTVARIVSFLGVGVLMLLIGYLAPVPPRAPEPRPADSPE